MRLTGSRAYNRPTPVPKMPSGLVELMEDLTRDVLKNNPPDVYEFCAEHMRKLLEIRDGPSPKQSLTLEQKIARAQEKIRKRGDARWQKYLKEKETEISHSKATLDNKNTTNDEETNRKSSSSNIQQSMKPPVYPDLNIEKASEIEISHEPGDVPDLPKNCVKKDIETGQKEVTTKNKELNANIEKAADQVTLNSNENKDAIIRNTEDVHNNNDFINEHGIVEEKVISNSNNNEIIEEVTAIKTGDKKVENHHALLSVEEAKYEKKEKYEYPSDPYNKELKADNVLVKEASEVLETAPIKKMPSDLLNYNKLEQNSESLLHNNSMTDMEKIVSTIVGVHNVLSETSGSGKLSNRKTDTDGVINDEEKKIENENFSTTDIEKQDLSRKTTLIDDNGSHSNTNIKENDIGDVDKSLEIAKNECSTLVSFKNDNLSDEASEYFSTPNSSSNALNTQCNKSVNENDKEQSNIAVRSIEEHSDRKIDDQKNYESDNATQKNMAEKNIVNNGDQNLETEINLSIMENYSKTDQLDNIDSVSKEVHAVSKQPVNVESVDAFAASNSIQVYGEEPLTNVLDIHETRNTQESNDGSIIEIRISQVAEALNNEEPLINEDNEKTSMEVKSCLVPSMENEVNTCFLSVVQNGDVKREKNMACLFQSSENIDESQSTITADTTDVTQNAKTSDTINSISIDESTDGLDNTSLIESGSSEAVDDFIQHNPNNKDSMDLETAAVTIQKVFRSFLFKSKASTFDENEDNISLDEDNEKKDELDFQVTNANLNKERRGISRMDTVLQTVNEEKSLSLSTDDSSTLSSAATTIQAHVRGFLVRNKLFSHKTASSNSLVNSDGPTASLDGDVDHKNKTILNIHIVPEGGNYLSRDESMLTSMELSLDGSPPSSLNLHPLGYDKNERRKQLKREDAIQSISPPSNNSGKLSEDSVKDMLITEVELQTDQKDIKDDAAKGEIIHNRPGSGDTSPTSSLTVETVIEAHKVDERSDAEPVTPPSKAKGILTKQSSDEMDVVTPFEDKISMADSRSTSKLLHSGEFHDIVLPTKVSRSDASVASEFKNVLVYFLLWNNS